MEPFISKEKTNPQLLKTKVNNFFGEYYNNVAFHKQKYIEPTGMLL